MRSLPDDLEPRALIGVLAEGWRFEVKTLDYAAVGGGSYHWVVTDASGTRGFVTVDDLDRKPWLGGTRESAFDGLRRAFDTAAALRDAGLDFVIAPITSNCGESVRLIGPRHSIALFPLVDGRAGRFGRYEPSERAAVSAMLADLHSVTPAVVPLTRAIDLSLPGRRDLESALGELDRTWLGGPFSEPARRALAQRASDVADLLAFADRLSADIANRATSWVVTHGEPHAANVMHTDKSHVLVDWDTVALAPPERDLWMLVSDTGDEATGYADATGYEPDAAALDFFRLTWDLADIAAFTSQLRSPHRHGEDTVHAYDALTYYLSAEDRWAALLGQSGP